MPTKKKNIKALRKHQSKAHSKGKTLPVPEIVDPKEHTRIFNLKDGRQLVMFVQQGPKEH